MRQALVDSVIDLIARLRDAGVEHAQLTLISVTESLRKYVSSMDRHALFCEIRCFWSMNFAKSAV